MVKNWSKIHQNSIFINPGIMAFLNVKKLIMKAYFPLFPRPSFSHFASGGTHNNSYLSIDTVPHCASAICRSFFWSHNSEYELFKWAKIHFIWKGCFDSIHGSFRFVSGSPKFVLLLLNIPRMNEHLLIIPTNLKVHFQCQDYGKWTNVHLSDG